MYTVSHLLTRASHPVHMWARAHTRGRCSDQSSYQGAFLLARIAPLFAQDRSSCHGHMHANARTRAHTQTTRTRTPGTNLTSQRARTVWYARQRKQPSHCQPRGRRPQRGDKEWARAQTHAPERAQRACFRGGGKGQVGVAHGTVQRLTSGAAGTPLIGAVKAVFHAVVFVHRDETATIAAFAHVWRACPCPPHAAAAPAPAQATQNACPLLEGTLTQTFGATADIKLLYSGCEPAALVQRTHARTRARAHAHAHTHAHVGAICVRVRVRVGQHMEKQQH